MVAAWLSAVWKPAIAVGLGLAGCWLALVVAVWRARPERSVVPDALRVIPDVVRLARDLCCDRTLPRRLRARLWFLVLYLVMPIDVVPDFIPVIGYADDAAVVILVLRSVVRMAGEDALVHHWRGSSQGLVLVRRLAGLDRS